MVQNKDYKYPIYCVKNCKKIQIEYFLFYLKNSNNNIEKNANNKNGKWKLRGTFCKNQREIHNFSWGKGKILEFPHFHGMTIGVQFF